MASYLGGGGGDSSIKIANTAADPVPVSIEGADVTINAEIGSSVEISNDAGNPIPISDNAGSLTVDDGGGSLTVDSTALTSIDGKLPALVGGKIPVDASVSISGGATEAKQDTLIAAVDGLEASVDGVEALLTTIDADTGSIDAKLPSLSGGSIPVVGPLTDTQLRASAVPVSPNVQQGGGAVTSSTTRVTLATDGPGVANLASIAGLAIPAHDYIALSYTGTNLTGVTYKTGGSGGTTVGTLTLAYSGSQLTSVTKS